MAKPDKNFAKKLSRYAKYLEAYALELRHRGLDDEMEFENGDIETMRVGIERVLDLIKYDMKNKK